MKYKYLKSIALISAMSTSVAMANGNEADAGVGYQNQTLDGLNQIYNPNDADVQMNKGFGTGTYYLFLGASGVTANSSSLEYNYGGAGCMQTTSGGIADGDFDLNLNLPDGHDLRGYRFYYNDTDDPGNISTTLFKFDGAGGLSIVASAASTGNAGFGNVWSGNMNHIIDNSTGAYVLRINLTTDGAAQEACGVRLFIDADPA